MGAVVGMDAHGWVREWQPVWEMLAALGTLAAVAVAVWVAVRESRRANREHGLRMEAQAKGEREEVERQARRVFVHLHRNTDSQVEVGGVVQYAASFDVRVHNHSDLPVYDAGREDRGARAASILPGESSLLGLEYATRPDDLAALAQRGQAPEVVVTFRDAMGRRWLISSAGRFERMPDAADGSG